MPNSQSPIKSCHQSGTVRSEFLLAAGIVLLGVMLLLGVSRIGFGAGYDHIGPRFFPIAVAAGLILLGCWLMLAAMRSAASSSRVAAPRTNWTAMAALGLAFLLNLALVERAGFVIASSAQFWLTARAFHSKRPLRDAVVAVLLSAAVYAGFTKGLGLTLPQGILRFLS